MANRITQVAAEVLVAPSGTKARTTQVAVEALTVPTSSRARTTQVAVEILTHFFAAAHRLTPTMRDGIVNHLFRSSSLAKPTSLYLALFTLPPGDTDPGTEVSGNGYARVTAGPGNAGWNGPTAGNGIATNAIDFVFPTPTADWGTLFAWGLYDSVVGGNLLLYSTFSTAITVAAGSNPRFPAGALAFTFA
jgi:hypothetical protein